jgi:hypothetical protein
VTIEWNLIIRCQGATTTLVSLYGSQSAMEARANLALVWGDAVEYVGPKLGQVPEKKNFASLSDLKDTLKRRRNSSQGNLQW